MNYILIEAPVNNLEELLNNKILSDVAQRLKLRLPIKENLLYKEESFAIMNGLNSFKCLNIPMEAQMKKRRCYFTAEYSPSLHKKYIL